jgi:lantibiotic modifying enzyme
MVIKDGYAVSEVNTALPRGSRDGLATYSEIAVTAPRKSDRYLAASVEVARWLEFVAVTDDHGDNSWPEMPDVSEDDSPSLGWGGLGPIVFFADAYRTLGERRWRDLASSGGRRLHSLLDDLDPDLPPGLFTGLAGWAVVFHELERVGLDFAGDTSRVVELLQDRAIRDGDGIQWADTTEVLWGTAGIGFLMLTIGVETVGDDALVLAAGAGDWLLNQAHSVGDGLRWDLGAGPQRERTEAAEIWFPNFAHVTAGIGAFLARLGAATDDDRYIEAARRAASWVLSTCRTEGGTCAAHHHDTSVRKGDSIGPARPLGDDSPMYTMGWCHGPPGLGWFFQELALATADPEWNEWIERTARTVRTSGIPERREPGFWDNVGRCCGSAGVAEYFLDLHTWRDDPDDLAFALLLVDDLLARASVDENGMRWHNVEFRRDIPELPSETTYFQGASGIGLALLRLSRHLDGDGSSVQWPHEPDWTRRAS